MMHVTRLELFGFKSFPERVVLPLEGGLTGIVGPNGCGKSNVVDALRWVLGETRASNLRGGLLEDVIFNGSEALRPLGLAEVTLTLRSDKQGDFASLTSPKAEASAVASIENSADEDASGADSEEQYTSDDALDQTSFGRRFVWLRDTSEVQVTRRLYRSGESEFFLNKVACRLKDLKDFFRAVGITARSYTIVAQGEVGRIVTSKPADRRTILEEAAGIAGFRDQAAESARRLAETRTNILRLEDIIAELSRQVSSLARQASRARRRAELKEQVSACEERVFLHRRTIFESHKNSFFDRESELADQELEIQDKYDQALAKETESRERYEVIEGQIDSLQQQLDDARSEATRIERERSRMVRELSEAESIISSVDKELVRLKDREARLAGRVQEAAEGLDRLRESELILDERIADAECTTEERLTDISARLKSHRASFFSAEKQFRDTREALIAAQSRLHAVEEQLRAMSPISLLGDGAGADFAVSISGKVEHLMEGLDVPEKFLKAVQAYLDDAAEFMLALDPLEIGEQFTFFLDGLTERERSGLGLGVIRRGGYADQNAFQERFVDDTVPFPPIAQCISYPESHQFAVESLFRDVYFVESTEEGIEFLRRMGADFPAEVTLVSAQGEIISKNSFFSRRQAGGFMQLRAQADKLQQEVQHLSQREKSSLEECRHIEELVEELELEQQEAFSEQQLQQQRVRDLGREQGTVKGQLVAGQQALSQVQADLEMVRREILENRNLKSSSESRLTEAQESLEMYEGFSLLEVEEKIDDLKLRIDESLRIRAGLRESFDCLRAETERLGGLLDEVSSARSHHALEARKIEIEFESMKERILEEYGEARLEELESLFAENTSIEPLQEHDLAKLQDMGRELRASLHRIGEVDPTVIQAYEEEKARLDEFTAQREDLSQAASLIEDSIERLTSTARRRFMETFVMVRATFSELIPRLFGGGSGDLTLSDPEAPLESGVDLLVRPPGKKPKSIDLLSGGEKALCATALIFALFRQRPSPLCVLDEVDAPLDDANLGRFLDLVRDTCSITQFLIITHNKITMAASDRLVGVTMPEPGASRLISVSLREAEKHVA